ncbi:MAG: YqjD family protein [Phycisphaerales bacterium]
MSNAATADGTGFKQDVSRLGQGVGTLTADVKNVAHNAADAARSGVAELRQGAHHAVEVAKEKFEGAREGAVEAAESLKGVISRNPVASIGIAAGVGLIIGLIVFRPRS